MRIPTRSLLGFRPSDEDGLAVIAVAMLGMALVIFSSMVALRAQRQSNGIRNDAEWSQALDVAEAGLDVGLIEIQTDPGFTTGELIPETFASPEAARTWLIAAADERPNIEIGETTRGEYVVVRPSNTPAIFAVGYLPSRDAEVRRIRVLRAEVGESPILRAWRARYAVLSGSGLLLNGNPTIISGATVGIHTNGSLHMQGSAFVEGCLSASNGATITGSISQDPECIPAGSQAPVLIPTIDASSFWEMSQFDLCPSGIVKAGPAHPTHGNTAANTPCTGATLAADVGVDPYRGWIFSGTHDSLGARWKHVSTIAYDGVYYIHHGSADISANAGSVAVPWQATIIAEGSGACPATVGGDIEISGGPDITPHPDAYNLLLAADRDVILSGNPSLTGLIATHEQIDSGGTVTGSELAILAEGACDSANDSVNESQISGNVTITNTGPVSSPFPGTEMIPVVINWNEL
ncbi:hypothetical protein HQ535_03825 [bacterium]|nr:hypothetical protein [bacterium]